MSHRNPPDRCVRNMCWSCNQLDMKTLLRDIAILEAEVVRLKHEIDDARASAAYWKGEAKYLGGPLRLP